MSRLVGILKQGQKIGIGALLKTTETAAPKPGYVKITQGIKEPFLTFVEKITAGLEKHVDNLRQILRRQLAKDNANDDCREIMKKCVN